MREAWKAWKCPHCDKSQLWVGETIDVLVSCKFCRGVSLIRSSKESPEVEFKDGYTIRRDIPIAILEENNNGT